MLTWATFAFEKRLHYLVSYTIIILVLYLNLNGGNEQRC